MKRDKNAYVSPEVSILNVETESALCAASNNTWYEEQGLGDFDYITETDKTWL